MEQPKKIVRIALDDVMSGFKHRISGELYGMLEDALARDIPNLLKDEKKRVVYDFNRDNQHLFITDPKHDIKVIRINEEIL